MRVVVVVVGDSGRVMVLVARRRRVRTAAERPLQSVYKQLFAADLRMQASQPVLVQRLSLHLANAHETCRLRPIFKYGQSY